MSERDNSGPAFPVIIEEEGCLTQVFHGMTLRDWFAGQALANSYTFSEAKPDKVAEWAYQIADAMLEARQ